MFLVNPKSKQPLYEQLVEQLRKQLFPLREEKVEGGKNDQQHVDDRGGEHCEFFGTFLGNALR